jgi:hypothetical protein
MRILAISDTHMEKWEPPARLEELIKEVDLVLHCGDFESYEVYKELKKYELIAVFGNADDERIKEDLSETEKFESGGIRFGLIHSGNYLNNFDDLGYKAREMEVDILVFGHIHRFLVKKIKDKVLISPGSPTQPRLSIASCALIEVNKGKVDVSMEVVQNRFCGMVRE